MAVANKVWKQVQNNYHSTMHCPTLPSLHMKLQAWLAEISAVHKHHCLVTTSYWKLSEMIMTWFDLS